MQRLEARSPGIDVERVYREQAPRLWRAVLVYAGDRDVASDAVAEAFAQVLGRGDDVRDVAAWVWRTAFRIAAAELQRRRRSGPEIVERGFDVDRSVPELLEALRTLSPMQRGSVVLHHYAGYPVGDVAEMLSSTRSAVRVHLFRGRKRLRELLEDDDG